MIRLFLLRILISWWMIPFSFLVISPLIYLLTGDLKSALRENKEFIHLPWYGEL